MVSHNHGKTFKVIKEALTLNGYYIKWKVLNGKDYGNIPQNRERIYIVGFLEKSAYDAFIFPDEIPLTTSLSDIIDFNGKMDEYYYYTEDKNKFYDELKSAIKALKLYINGDASMFEKNKTGVVPTLTANMGTGGHNVPLILTKDKRIRKLTPKETFNAQGYPLDYKLPDNIAKGNCISKQGNSVVVPLVKRIALNISIALDNSNNESNCN